jgi:hypothetical protein
MTVRDTLGTMPGEVTTSNPIELTHRAITFLNSGNLDPVMGDPDETPAAAERLAEERGRAAFQCGPRGRWS